MLKLGRATKVKVFFLVLVNVFNFDLFEFSAAIWRRVYSRATSALMTDYYGAFSTSTSNFPGQIQSATIDTSYKSILTCLYNNKKI